MDDAKRETVIAGRYRILRRIGRGGMSEVFLVSDLTLQNQWALKMVRKGTTVSEKRREEMLIAEAMLLKQLSHPGLPRVVDLFPDDNCTCVVMDYVDGHTLQEVVMRDGPVQGRRAVSFARQLCDLLSYLHGLDPPVIYRDLKPSNIICSTSGRLCLIDFGIALSHRASGSDADSSSRTLFHQWSGQTEQTAGESVPHRAGTRGYSAPEQLKEGICDERSDLYAFGMTMYFAVTGLEPWRSGFGRNVSAVKRISQLKEVCPDGLAEIICRCAAQDPRKRYASCKELMADLLHPEMPAVRKKRRMIRQKAAYGFAISATVVILCAAIFYRAVLRFTEEETYAAKLDPARTIAPDAREQSYLEAIGLEPGNREAFDRLVELYETEKAFDEQAGRTLLTQINQNRPALSGDGEAWCDLLYRVGRLFFFRFQGGDGSARERILRAEPIFSEWAELEKASGNKEAARQDCFWTFCDFYRRYTTEMIRRDYTEIGDPDKREIRSVTEAVSRLLEQLDQYSGGDRTNVRFTVLRELAGFLSTWRFALCEAEIPEEEVAGLMDRIYLGVRETNALRADVREEKEQLEADCVLFQEQICAAWDIREQALQ